MSIYRRAKRVDANQAAVVSALKAAGASVEILSRPVDLLIGYRGKTLLIEVKNPNSARGKAEMKKGGNANQVDFKAGWLGGPVATVDGPDAALRALGVIP